MQKNTIVKGKCFPLSALSHPNKKKQSPSRFQLFSFKSVRGLSVLKLQLLSLPSHTEYSIKMQVDYARTMSCSISIIRTVRLQEINWGATVEGMKRVLVQLARQTQFKEIVLTLLGCILKGGISYWELVETDLFQMLKSLKEFERRRKDGMLIPSKGTRQVSLNLLIIATDELISIIIRWYGYSTAGRDICLKYQGLLQAKMDDK